MKPKPFKVGTGGHTRINGVVFDVWLVPRGMVPTWHETTAPAHKIELRDGQPFAVDRPLAVEHSRIGPTGCESCNEGYCPWHAAHPEQDDPGSAHIEQAQQNLETPDLPPGLSATEWCTCETVGGLHYRSVHSS